MQIEVSKLREISKKLFSHLENNGYDQVELEVDFYWNIPEEEKYQMENSPKDLDIGQLDEDWDFLQEVLKQDHEPIGYEFVWLGKVLEAIGEKVVR